MIRGLARGEATGTPLPLYRRHALSLSCFHAGTVSWLVPQPKGQPTMSDDYPSDLRNVPPDQLRCGPCESELASDATAAGHEQRFHDGAQTVYTVPVEDDHGGMQVELVYTQQQVVDLLTVEGFDQAAVRAELADVDPTHYLTPGELEELRWALL